MRLRISTAAGLALLSPAAFFMVALAFRNLLPTQYELALIAQRVVMWYAGRMWTLWVLLLALPFVALTIGCTVLKRDWSHHTNAKQFAKQSLAIGATTIAAGGMLTIVVLHMLAD
jgi:hypothetical protein